MNEQPNKKEIADYCHAAIKIGLNAVPIVGGAFGSLFETVFESPLDRRKKLWLDKVIDVVNDLCKRIEDLTPEKLSENEMFVTAFLQASNIAIKTHQEEKITYLQSAIKNCVLLADYEETKKLIFIKAIDDLLPLHFNMLFFLSNPSKYLTDIDRSHEEKDGLIITSTPVLASLWTKNNPEFPANGAIFSLAFKELFRLGFIAIDNIGLSPKIEPATTTFGNEFIQFVSKKS